MKKILILIIFLAILILNVMQTKSSFSFSEYFSFGDLTIYSKSASSEFLPNIEINGDGNVIGESIRFAQVEPMAILETLKAKICFYEYIQERDLTIIYSYSPLIEKKVTVKNEIINLQLAYTEFYTVLGWPLILGSF